MSFASRLNDAILTKQSRLMVGLDPHFELLPPELTLGLKLSDRRTLASAVSRFCVGILDAVADYVVAIKPQVAFFERLGPPGFEALESTVQECRSRGLVVISDAKRGDIGSTAAAYADYHLGSESSGPGAIRGLGADAITLNPYLGRDSLLPFLVHVRSGKGLFLLAKTSNQSSSDFQDRMFTDGGEQKRLYVAVAELAQSLGEGIANRSSDYSSIGVVVGATHPAQLVELRFRFPNLLFLVPGVGAQGATPTDVSAAFDRRGLGAIVNASRSVLFAYKDARSHENWKSASRYAARALRDALNDAISTQL